MEMLAGSIATRKKRGSFAKSRLNRGEYEGGSNKHLISEADLVPRFYTRATMDQFPEDVGLCTL
jgi:hypothetical protein